MGVSSREKINTNRNLERATTKSKSETQTVSMDMLVKGEEMDIQGASQCRRPRRMSKIEAK